MLRLLIRFNCVTKLLDVVNHFRYVLAWLAVML